MLYGVSVAGLGASLFLTDHSFHLVCQNLRHLKLDSGTGSKVGEPADFKPPAARTVQLFNKKWLSISIPFVSPLCPLASRIRTLAAFGLFRRSS